MQFAIMGTAITVMVLSIVCGGVMTVPQAMASSYQDEPDQRLADELSHRKVVMLADFCHGDAYPFQSLIRVLEARPANRRSPRSLTLFLECDSEAANNLSEYLRTGDMETLLDYYLPSGMLEQLEFYADLRDVVLRGDDDSEVWVRGVEPGTIYDIPEVSAAECYRLFVEERDSKIATGILDHIGEFPEREILVFYGNLHLLSNRVRKPNAPPGYPAEKTEGYYLAHYLKSALGDDAVLTVNQLNRPPGQQGAKPGWPVDRDILVDWDVIPANWLHPDQLDYEYDVVVVRSQTRIGPHPLRQVCCRRVVEETIEDLERLAPFEPDGHFAVIYADRDRQSLKLVTGEAFSDPVAWRRWQSAQVYDGVSHLMSPEFEDLVMTLICELEKEDYNAAKQLVGLGLRMKDLVTILNSSRETRRAFWIKHRSKVFALQAIGMSWCGDDEEREWAHRYLTDLAGREFETPSQAMKWWRARFQSVTY